MKKILLPILMVGIFAMGTVSANNDKCPTCSHKKVSQTKAVRKSKKGLKHGYYDVTHNKATRAAKINHGNQKYKNQDDIR